AHRAVELARLRRQQQLPRIPSSRRDPGTGGKATMRIVITGSGAICGAGQTPAAIVDAVQAGRSAIAPITSFDVTGWPRRYAAEVTDYDAARLAGDRKLLKLIRRSDVFGIHAAGTAIAEARLAAHRQTLDEAATVAFAEGTGC